MKKLPLLSAFAPGFIQTDSHIQVVDELMEAMHMKEQIAGSTDRMMNVQLQSMPQLAPYKGTMSEFFDKYVSWKNSRMTLRRCTKIC